MTAKGKLNYCPTDWFSLANICDYNETTIKDVWHSNFYKELRSKHLCNKYSDNDFCKSCPDWSNTSWPHDKEKSYADLVEKILSEYIGKKVMALEIEKSGITINDNSLRNIIKNDKLFFKNKKFSRTEYEKFLLESGVTAPSFEQNIIEQESRRQFLSFLAGGITIPDTLVENAFKKENQTKMIKYIDLEKYHSSKNPSHSKIKELYNKNKNLFI